MWQEDLVSVADFINECLDKVYISAAGPFHMARHLISPMWPEEIEFDDDDSSGICTPVCLRNISHRRRDSR